MRLTRRLVLTGLAALVAGCGGGSVRDQIRVVGSSTVYPFTTTIAERFVNDHPEFKAPVIESTGTGAGMKLFCAGIGPRHPDIVDASRRMRASEYAACRANGAGAIMEVPIGIDGVALAEANAGPKLQLTRRDVYLALAATPGGRPNTARRWRDVNAGLPDIPILVNGPPATSGTRDAFVELVMTPGCEAAVPAASALKVRNRDAFDRLCTRLREDGAYVDKGENDNLIVQALKTNADALGIFGYSYLEENRQLLHGVPLDGVEPTGPAIASGRYPGARPLYIYVKAAHLRAVPGLRRFLAGYAAAWGPGGPLERRGLIVGHDDSRRRSEQIVARNLLLQPASLPS